MRFPTKEELGDKLAYYPMLRQLLFESWFGVAFGCLAVLVLALGLMLPKIWRKSPEGFLPVIRVSGLDLIQSWSLRRNARKSEEAGKVEEAIYSWHSAFANNPSDARNIQGFLRLFIAQDAPKAHRGPALNQSLWLLRLRGTNDADLELVSEVYSKSGNNLEIISLLEPRKERLTPKMETAYMAALFRQSRVGEFASRWEGLPPAVKSDPELDLYYAAFEAGWGPVGQAQRGWDKLNQALTDPKRQVLSARVQLAIYGVQRDPENYARILQRLEEWHADNLLHHIGLWELLAETGNTEQAKKLASSQPQPPSTINELAGLVQIYSKIGLSDEATRILKQSAATFGFSEYFWLIYSDHLIAQKDWETLSRIALEIRNHENVRDKLGGYSYYLEGRAEFAEERYFAADGAFEKLRGWAVSRPNLAFGAANSLLKLGYPEVAKDLLLKVESEYSKTPRYWHALFEAADKLKDVDLMLTCARQAYSMQPTDHVAINNYAATLLILRQDPEEAIKLTFMLQGRNPRSIASRVNHSAALMLNSRPEEAEKILTSVNPADLTPQQLNLFNYDLLELQVALKRFDQAKASLEKINPAGLYPPQRDWLEKIRKQLEPVASTASSNT